MFRKMVFLSLILLVAAKANAEGLRDPTRPSILEDQGLDTNDTKQVNLTIEYILISPTRRIVVINGRTFAEGDFLGRMQIGVIAEHSVGLISDGETYYLKPGEKTKAARRSS